MHFPLEALKEKGVHRAQVGEREVVLFADARGGFFGAFYVEQDFPEVALSGRALRASDGRTWNAITGGGDSGQLEFAPLIRSFWFGWVQHYPGSELWQGPE